MTTTSDTLARRERQALCDLASSLDDDSPTLCGEWDLPQLLAHLIVRERRPLSAGGIMIAALAGVTERAMVRESAKGVPAMVALLRKPPLTPYSLPVVERFTQTLEYFVHHEDIRRAQPDWAPRELTDEDTDELWSLLSRSGAYPRAWPAGPDPDLTLRPSWDECRVQEGRGPRGGHWPSE